MAKLVDEDHLALNIQVFDSAPFVLPGLEGTESPVAPDTVEME
jgi:hypothetical protein